jgi:hypothetical protein
MEANSCGLGAGEGWAVARRLQRELLGEYEPGTKVTEPGTKMTELCTLTAHNPDR